MQRDENDLMVRIELMRRVHTLEKELCYMREQYAALEGRYNALVEQLDTLSTWANCMGRKGEA